MPNPTVIAHLSDLHLSPTHHRRNTRNSQRLLEYALKLNADHVVVTGDITANADPREFALARKLFEAYGLLDPARLSVVIGNHDVFGGAHTAEDILTFPARCKGTDYDAKVREFVEAFGELFQGTVQEGKGSVFPYLKIVGGVALLGLNSIARYSAVKNPVGSNGIVSDDQMTNLRGMLSSGVAGDRRILALIHHHFSKKDAIPQGALPALWGAVEYQTMKLRGKKKLMRVFEKYGVSWALHGHVHETHSYRRRGIHFLNAGGSVLGSASVLSMNVVQVHGRKVTNEIHQIDASSPLVHRKIPAAADAGSLESQAA